MKNKILGAAIAASISTSALAGITDGPYTFINSSPAELIADGFADVTGGNPLISYPTGECEGCYTMPVISSSTFGTIPLKGFIEIDVDGDLPLVNDGIYVAMEFIFNNPAFTRDDMISIVDGSAANAYDFDYTNPQGCAVIDWIDTSIFDPDNSILFQWDPVSTSGPWTFGWDFTGGSGFGGLFPGIEIDDIGSTPAPGALALLGIAGLAGSRRRRL